MPGIFTRKDLITEYGLFKESLYKVKTFGTRHEATCFECEFRHCTDANAAQPRAFSPHNRTMLFILTAKQLKGKFLHRLVK